MIQELERERERRPELAEQIDLYLELVQIAPGPEAPQVRALDKEEAGVLLNEGIPLLQKLDYEEQVLSSPAFQEVYEQVCDITTRHRPELTGTIAMLRPFSPKLPEELECGGEQEGEERPRRREILHFLLNGALHPFLKRAAQELKPLLEGATWYRSSCPICGGEPDFAGLSLEKGARSLLCSRCDTEWDYQRTGCPCCKAEGTEIWGYYPGEGGRYRLYACESCKRYLKTIDLREVGQMVCLPVERVVTVAMDVAAWEAGYRGGVR